MHRRRQQQSLFQDPVANALLMQVLNLTCLPSAIKISYFQDSLLEPHELEKAMSVESILRQKGTDVATITPEASIKRAADWLQYRRSRGDEWKRSSWSHF